MNTALLKYQALTYRRDQLWFPLALWGLFAVILLFISRDAQSFDIVRAYLSAAPLTGGIMAAYALLDDPALELRFATPVRAWQLILQGTVLTFAIQALGALSFIALTLALGMDFSPLGNGSAVHLAWLIPTVTMIALGTFGAALGAHPVAGSFLVGLVWLMEVIIRDGMTVNHWKYAYLFMGILSPEHPDLVANQWALIGAALVFLFGAWLLLHKQERYI